MSGSGSGASERPTGTGLFRMYATEILKNLPEDWRGTTFNNSNLLGREAFTTRLLKYLQAKRAAGRRPTLQLFDRGHHAQRCTRGFPFAVSVVPLCSPADRCDEEQLTLRLWTGASPITTEELSGLGIAEDYLRVCVLLTAAPILSALALKRSNQPSFPSTS